ncbi:hypothetical protein BD410DRAFT_790568 [Rickenella mellea]|uniref:Uncharacterized protein n=1 Tax=Rickenella mellea TaxID=50990 RepID=A0A4Y7Q120_9AGAM|nr:hypothetical protein BD410DRAFT_790568 [Rickenella mellea]
MVEVVHQNQVNQRTNTRLAYPSGLGNWTLVFETDTKSNDYCRIVTPLSYPMTPPTAVHELTHGPETRTPPCPPWNARLVESSNVFPVTYNLMKSYLGLESESGW